MSGAAAFIPSRASSIVLLVALAGEFLVPLALARSWLHTMRACRP